MGMIESAVKDGVITFLWMLVVPTVGPTTGTIAKSLGITWLPMILGISVLLMAAILLVFTKISGVLGGASFNPANSAAFYTLGFGGKSIYPLALRFPVQALGAVAGVVAIREVMPSQYKGMLKGPFLKVDLHTGALAEGILGFAMTFAVLFVIIKGPKNPLIKSLMLATSTVSLVFTGSGYTGPSLNPINAYGWAYINDCHNSWEHFYVYWIPSFVGAILAAWVFRFLFLQPAAPKVKKA